jgi:hypothetical protein
MRFRRIGSVIAKASALVPNHGYQSSATGSRVVSPLSVASVPVVDQVEVWNAHKAFGYGALG